MEEYVPGTDLTLEERQKIIDECLRILKQDRFANIKYVAIHFPKIEIKYLDDAVIIACRISENSIYEWAFSEKDGWPYLFVNPSHERNQASLRTSNVQRKALIITVIVSIVTLIITGVNIYLTNKSNQQKQINIQEQLNNLKLPTITIDSVVVHQTSIDPVSKPKKP